MKLYLFSILLLISINVQAQENYTILRHPAISPDGSEIAFSYQGDIWTIPAEGGKSHPIDYSRKLMNRLHNGARMENRSSLHRQEMVMETSTPSIKMVQMYAELPTIRQGTGQLPGWITITSFFLPVVILDK